MTQRITLPTKSLLQGAAYTPAASSDIRVRFRLLQQAQQQQASENVKPLRRQGK